MSKVTFTVELSDFELVKRIEVLSNELDISIDESVEIAIDRFLNDFNEIIHLWTCRKAVVKRDYRKPKEGDVF